MHVLILYRMKEKNDYTFFLGGGEMFLINFFLNKKGYAD